MKQEKKLKVVWLCVFTNSKVQQIFKPFKKSGEISPWISDLIGLFENNDSIELHIVSQHKWILKAISFKEQGVFYHFLHKGIPLLGIRWPKYFRLDYWTDFHGFKSRVRQKILNIDPDLIHMHGAENEFCTSIIQFKEKYPVFITIQGFIHKTSIKKKEIIYRANKELEIIKMFKHFGFRTNTMGADIKKINPKAILHWHDYKLRSIEPIKSEKTFDLVFFAKMSKDKGVEDLLHIVHLIKRTNHNIRLCAIGGGDTSGFKKLAEELNISENIEWTGFLNSQKEVHAMASRAKVSVLPTHHDIVSGTIIESLLLELPIVAYNVGSIHEVNQKEEIISLVDKGDIQGFADAILHLLENKESRVAKSEQGRKRAVEMFCKNDQIIQKDIMNAYYSVLRDFQPC